MQHTKRVEDIGRGCPLYDWWGNRFFCSGWLCSKNLFKVTLLADLTDVEIKTGLRIFLREDENGSTLRLICTGLRSLISSAAKFDWWRRRRRKEKKCDFTCFVSICVGPFICSHVEAFLWIRPYFSRVKVLTSGVLPGKSCSAFGKIW